MCAEYVQFLITVFSIYNDMLIDFFNYVESNMKKKRFLETHLK